MFLHTQKFSNKDFSKTISVLNSKNNGDKIQLNLKVFSYQVALSINGRALYDDAVQELEKIEEMAKERFELPPDFIVG